MLASVSIDYLPLQSNTERAVGSVPTSLPSISNPHTFSDSLFHKLVLTRGSDDVITLV